MVRWWFCRCCPNGGTDGARRKTLYSAGSGKRFVHSRACDTKSNVCKAVSHSPVYVAGSLSNRVLSGFVRVMSLCDAEVKLAKHFHRHAKDIIDAFRIGKAHSKLQE